MGSFVYEEIVKKICDEKQLLPGDVHVKVKEKLQQLSDLISKEGAAHIVANELGVKVYDIPKMLGRRVTVTELQPSFRGFEMLVKVLQNNGTRSFKTQAREGRVANLLVGDETGACRLVLWDEKHIKDIESGALQEGVTLKLLNCYVRENTFGVKEVHMGNQGSWVLNPLGQELSSVVVTPVSVSAERKAIKDLAEHDIVTLVGTIVQIFEPRNYDACPQCGKKVLFQNTGYFCTSHGSVSNAPQPILNFIFDDGTDNIRVVCFRDLVRRVLEIEDVSLLKERPEMFRDVQRKVAGKQLSIQGRVQRNVFFNRLELSVSSLRDANPKELAVELQ